MRTRLKPIYEFGPFHLNAEERLLTKQGKPVALTPKVFDTLLLLVENSGRLIDKDELMRSVWPDAVVEENNLNRSIYVLRKALSETSGAGKYIETVPKHGFRFVASVIQVETEEAEVIVERHRSARIITEEEEIIDSSYSAAEGSLEDRFPAIQRIDRLPASWRRTLAAGVAAVALFGVLIYFWSTGKLGGSTPANIKSIAVLPFKSIDASEEDTHRGLGLADILITRLSNIKELNVRPTSAVMTLDNKDVDSISAGRKLEVDAVLEGTIYRTTDKLRVTTRLVRVSDQSPIWAGQFEKPLQDELRLQDEIALQVVNALALNLSGNEQRALTKRFTESAEAYELYVKGRYHWNKRNYEGLQEAERLFRNAIDRDPNFALAYVGLADTAALFQRQSDLYQALGKALELDPNLAEAHATRGFAHALHGWSWRDAEVSFKRSIELNQGYATAHHWYAILLGIEGRLDEAKAELRRALEINPLSYNFLADLGQVYYFAHDYDTAKQYCYKALELYPDFGFAHEHLAQLYRRTGEYEAAIQQTLKGELAFSDVANAPAGRAQSKSAKLDEALDLYHRRGIRAYLESRFADCPSCPHELNLTYGRAEMHALLGDKEKALDNLEKALEVRAFLMAWVKADPVFDCLRAEPRYQAILQKMQLPPDTQ
jgi:DNA-binding winged helix-turn-helix (wHTH) protein/TolB-like protein